jgi:hypothetical protein
VGQGIDPEESATYDSRLGLQNAPHAPWQKRIVQRIVRNRKIMRIFLIGTLFGVMITAAVTYAFAIPANSDYWRMEIYKRGGAVWTVDRAGHVGWKWMVEPILDTPPQNHIIAPPSAVKVKSERL